MLYTVSHHVHAFIEPVSQDADSFEMHERLEKILASFSKTLAEAEFKLLSPISVTSNFNADNSHE